MRFIGRVAINGWPIRGVYVPPATNDGSAIAADVVLMSTVGRHTYDLGFHKIKSVRATFLLDEQLARYVRLVRP